MLTPTRAAALHAWARGRLGERMSAGPDALGGQGRRHGTAVDYKLDTAGLGVFFVLDRGPDLADRYRYKERYLLAPAALLGFSPRLTTD